MYHLLRTTKGEKETAPGSWPPRGAKNLLTFVQSRAANVNAYCSKGDVQLPQTVVLDHVWMVNAHACHVVLLVHLMMYVALEFVKLMEPALEVLAQEEIYFHD